VPTGSDLSSNTIVFLRPFFQIGGTENVMNTLSTQLMKKGYKIVYVLNRTNDIQTKIAEGVQVISIDSPIPTSGANIFNVLQLSLRMAKQYRKIKALYKGSVFVALDAGTISHFWASFFAGLRPLYLWMHSSIKEAYASSRNWVFNKWIFRLADGTIAITAEMANEVEELLGNGYHNKIMVIENPLTLSIKRNLYSRGSKIFVYVGRLDNNPKRIDRILKAFAKLVSRNFKLVIVGDGKDKAKLQAMSEELGIDRNMIWAGWQNDPWSYIKDNFGGVEALLLTSDYEGYGMVLVEAMANGIPCVAVDCPVGPSDIIQDGVNGVLIPLTSDEQIIKDLSDVLKEFLEEKFVFDEDKIKASVADHDPSAVVQKWIELIEEHES